jgi:acetate kinase
MLVLTLNAGSSSEKCALYDLRAAPPVAPQEPLWEATAQWDGGDAEITTRHGMTISTARVTITRDAAVRRMITALWQEPEAPLAGPEEIALVGHRVVHGGAALRQPMIVTPAVRDGIAAMAELAPLHTTAALAGIAAVADLLPHARQVAVFDTAFHQTMPLAAQIIPGPYAWFGQGVRRYGFHGISHQSAMERGAALLGRDVRELDGITCHLGNGASLAAIHAGQSVETTMSFTPLDGIMMGTRAGAIDPGAIMHLLRQPGQTVAGLEATLNRRSGLLGVSGESGDMRDILRLRAAGHARAALAYDTFVHRLRLGIGAMLAALGRVDVVIFTGGIGEHAPDVRADAMRQFAFAGVAIDPARNLAATGDTDISAGDATVRTLVIHADENWAMARACWHIATIDD